MHLKPVWPSICLTAEIDAPMLTWTAPNDLAANALPTVLQSKLLQSMTCLTKSPAMQPAAIECRASYQFSVHAHGQHCHNTTFAYDETRPQKFRNSTT